MEFQFVDYSEAVRNYDNWTPAAQEKQEMMTAPKSERETAINQDVTGTNYLLGPGTLVLPTEEDQPVAVGFENELESLNP